MTLGEWLAHIERQHERPVDLGLDRLRPVANRLGQAVRCPLFLVGGTNGKGSTCAMLERILLAAGYRVGLYTSPHLCTYAERVRIDGRPATDEQLCAGFQRVDEARAGAPLTYFEFATLAAWETFSAHDLDAIILEVGLGGRLDATNLYDADVAIVTTVDLDHMDFLGPTREAIGFEKAGIFRSGLTAICGDRQPPRSLLDQAAAIGADLQLIGRDFHVDAFDRQWRWRGRHGSRSGMAFPALRGDYQLDNAACVLAALEAVADRLPVAMQHVREGLALVSLPGRCQVLPGRPELVVDVGHNPQAAAALARNLAGMQPRRQTWVILGMLQDKDIAGVIEAFRGALGHPVDRWLLVDLPGPRGAAATTLQDRLPNAVVRLFQSPAEAWQYARGAADGDDRIVAFGSFLTVADILCAHDPDAAKRT